MAYEHLYLICSTRVRPDAGGVSCRREDGRHHGLLRAAVISSMHTPGSQTRECVNTRILEREESVCLLGAVKICQSTSSAPYYGAHAWCTL